MSEALLSRFDIIFLMRTEDDPNQDTHPRFLAQKLLEESRCVCYGTAEIP